MFAKIREYIDKEYKIDETVPTIAGLAVFLDVDRKTIYNWIESNKRFFHIAERLMSIQEKKLLTGGLLNKYNSTTVKLMLTKHGYKDESKQSIDTEEMKSLSELYKSMAEKKYDEPKGNDGDQGQGKADIQE
jgi:hypothetical protein